VERRHLDRAALSAVIHDQTEEGMSMRLTSRLVAVLLIPMFLISSPALAQQPRVVDDAAMSQALAGKAAGEQEQRQQVLRVLERDDVREVAARLGLDVADARAAVATLGGAELGTLAQHAEMIEDPLAGGQRQTRVVISVTTLLLIIIIIILIAR
jgi:hypothetical protein